MSRTVVPETSAGYGSSFAEPTPTTLRFAWQLRAGRRRRHRRPHHPARRGEFRAIIKWRTARWGNQRRVRQRVTGARIAASRPMPNGNPTGSSRDYGVGIRSGVRYGKAISARWKKRPRNKASTGFGRLSRGEKSFALSARGETIPQGLMGTPLPTADHAMASPARRERSLSIDIALLRVGYCIIL